MWFSSNRFPEAFLCYNLLQVLFLLQYRFICNNKAKQETILKDVRAHCYCASLVRTLYMTWRVPRHVFQARAPSRNSTKYRADDLCGNLICEYFCWMLGDTHFFFCRSLPFLILSMGSFNYFSYTIQIGSNWYMDRGVRDLEVACLRLILPESMI